MGSFGRITFAALLIACSCINYSNGARCPPPNWIKPTRTCISDKECYPGLCCPDYLGRKSCANPQGARHPNAINIGTAGKFVKPNYGFNCDGTKCIPGEICKAHHLTKRRRCQKP